MSFISRQVRRATERMAAKFRSDPVPHKRQVEAGAGGRRWQGAGTMPAPVQSTLAARVAAKARAASLYVNSAQGNRIVEAWTAALAGKGISVPARAP